MVYLNPAESARVRNLAPSSILNTMARRRPPISSSSSAQLSRLRLPPHNHHEGLLHPLRRGHLRPPGSVGPL